MPQMMPLNWLSMFLFINMIMISFMILLFNYFNPTPPQMTTKKTNSSIIKWAW